MSDMTPKELTALKLKFYDALICDPELSAMDLRIAWLLLSKYLNARSLIAWPSAENLARDLGSSLSGVRRSIQRLTAAEGWFKVKKGGGRRHSNVYSANFKRVAATPPFEAETVASARVNGGVSVPETVASTPPNSLLREPIEEPFEARGARSANQKAARQGDRAGGANRSQREILYSFDGGNQPSWPTWLAWLQELGMTGHEARRWLAKWGDDLGGDEVDRRLQRIRDAGPTGQGGLNDRMIAEGAVREPGQVDVA